MAFETSSWELWVLVAGCTIAAILIICLIVYICWYCGCCRCCKRGKGRSDDPEQGTSNDDDPERDDDDDGCCTCCICCRRKKKGKSSAKVSPDKGQTRTTSPNRDRSPITARTSSPGGERRRARSPGAENRETRGEDDPRVQEDNNERMSGCCACFSSSKSRPKQTRNPDPLTYMEVEDGTRRHDNNRRTPSPKNDERRPYRDPLRDADNGNRRQENVTTIIEEDDSEKKTGCCAALCKTTPGRKQDRTRKASAKVSPDRGQRGRSPNNQRTSSPRGERRRDRSPGPENRKDDDPRVQEDNSERKSGCCACLSSSKSRSERKRDRSPDPLTHMAVEDGTRRHENNRRTPSPKNDERRPYRDPLRDPDGTEITPYIQDDDSEKKSGCCAGLCKATPGRKQERKPSQEQPDNRRTQSPKTGSRTRSPAKVDRKPRQNGNDTNNRRSDTEPRRPNDAIVQEDNSETPSGCCACFGKSKPRPGQKKENTPERQENRQENSQEHRRENRRAIQPRTGGRVSPVRDPVESVVEEEDEANSEKRSGCCACFGSSKSRPKRKRDQSSDPLTIMEVEDGTRRHENNRRTPSPKNKKRTPYRDPLRNTNNGTSGQGNVTIQDDESEKKSGCCAGLCMTTKGRKRDKNPSSERPNNRRTPSPKNVSPRRKVARTSRAGPSSDTNKSTDDHKDKKAKGDDHKDKKAKEDEQKDQKKKTKSGCCSCCFCCRPKKTGSASDDESPESPKPQRSRADGPVSSTDLEHGGIEMTEADRKREDREIAKKEAEQKRKERGQIEKQRKEEAKIQEQERKETEKEEAEKKRIERERREQEKDLERQKRRETERRKEQEKRAEEKRQEEERKQKAEEQRQQKEQKEQQKEKQQKQKENERRQRDEERKQQREQAEELKRADERQRNLAREKTLDSMLDRNNQQNDELEKLRKKRDKLEKEDERKDITPEPVRKPIRKKRPVARTEQAHAKAKSDNLKPKSEHPDRKKRNEVVNDDVENDLTAQPVRKQRRKKQSIRTKEETDDSNVRNSPVKPRYLSSAKQRPSAFGPPIPKAVPFWRPAAQPIKNYNFSTL